MATKTESGKPKGLVDRVKLRPIHTRVRERHAGFTDPPVRTDLQRPEFIPFVDQIVGKQVSYRDPALLVDLLPEVTEFWNSLWLGRGGKPRR